MANDKKFIVADGIISGVQTIVDSSGVWQGQNSGYAGLPGNPGPNTTSPGPTGDRGVQGDLQRGHRFSRRRGQDQRVLREGLIEAGNQEARNFLLLVSWLPA